MDFGRRRDWSLIVFGWRESERFQKGDQCLRMKCKGSVDVMVKKAYKRFNCWTWKVEDERRRHFFFIFLYEVHFGCPRCKRSPHQHTNSLDSGKF